MHPAAIRAAVAALLFAASARAEGPLSLPDAMARARANAGEPKAAAARREAADERVRQARGFRLPSVTLSETYTRTDAPAESFALALNRETFSFPAFVAGDPNDPGWSGTAITRLEAALPLFTGGELSARIRQAELTAEAAAGTAGRAGDGAALAAAAAWVQLAQAEEYARLLEKSRETMAAHAAFARDWVAQGMLVRSELLRAEVEEARMEDLLAEARGRVRLANASLAFRLGAPQTESWELAPLPAPTPIDTNLTAWVAASRERPDLVAARRLQAAGELEVKVRRAAFYPKLGVSARLDLLGTRLFGATGRNGTVVAFASWSVFSGFSDRAAVSAAAADARAGKQDVARLEEAVELETRQAFEEVSVAREKHATAVHALTAAREAERITADRFRSGVARTLDVLDAATARRDAETRELVARADAHAASLRLAVAAGRAPESVLPETREK